MKNTPLIQPESGCSRFSSSCLFYILSPLKLVFDKELKLIYISVLQETKELVAIKKFKDSEGKRLLPNACFIHLCTLLHPKHFKKVMAHQMPFF